MPGERSLSRTTSPGYRGEGRYRVANFSMGYITKHLERRLRTPTQLVGRHTEHHSRNADGHEAPS
jgi:hypothetical protein